MYAFRKQLSSPYLNKILFVVSVGQSWGDSSLIFQNLCLRTLFNGQDQELSGRRNLTLKAGKTNFILHKLMSI